MDRVAIERSILHRMLVLVFPPPRHERLADTIEEEALGIGSGSPWITMPPCMIR